MFFGFILVLFGCFVLIFFCFRRNFYVNLHLVLQVLSFGAIAYGFYVIFSNKVRKKNKTKQNKTKQNKTKQNKNNQRKANHH